MESQAQLGETISIEEAARRMGVHPNSLRVRFRRGEVPGGFRQGRRCLIHLALFDAGLRAEAERFAAELSGN